MTTTLRNYVSLGRSGVRVSPLCLGAMTFGEDWGWGSNVEASKQIMDRYIDLGGNFIDTANGYTKGHSEAIIGEHLAKMPLGILRASLEKERLGKAQPRCRPWSELGHGALEQGNGRVTVNDETVAIKNGDAIPVDLGQSKSFKAGSEPLELLIVGVAKDIVAKNAFAANPANE